MQAGKRSKTGSIPCASAAAPGRRPVLTERHTPTHPLHAAEQPRSPATKPFSHSGGSSSTFEATQPRMASISRPGPCQGREWAGRQGGGCVRRGGVCSGGVNCGASERRAAAHVLCRPSARCCERCWLGPCTASSFKLPLLPCAQSTPTVGHLRKRAAVNVERGCLWHPPGKARQTAGRRTGPSSAHRWQSPSGWRWGLR